MKHADARRVGGFEDQLSEALAVQPTLASRRSIDARVRQAIASPEGHGARRSARSRRRIILSLAVAGLLGRGAAVAAGGFGAFDSVMTAPYSAQEYDAQVAAAMATTPLPPGYAYPDLRATDRSGHYGDGLGVVEYNAWCAWLDYWHAGLIAGNARQVGDALSVIRSAVGWRSFSDPAFIAPSSRDYVLGIIAAARAGDVTPVERELTLNCRR